MELRDRVGKYTTRSVELRNQLEKGTIDISEFIGKATYNDELLKSQISELDLMAHLVEAKDMLDETPKEFTELIKIRQERLTVISELIESYAVEAETIQFYLKELS
tara:strand:- start:20885 stop:21202 length:318 start_codon:yes stop_codon:yes gene_type:complete